VGNKKWGSGTPPFFIVRERQITRHTANTEAVILFACFSKEKAIIIKGMRQSTRTDTPPKNTTQRENIQKRGKAFVSKANKRF